MVLQKRGSLEIVIIIFMAFLIIFGVILFIVFKGESSKECEEDWRCTDWSNGDCGTRECTDVNDCDTFKNNPIEVKDCQEGETLEVFEGIVGHEGDELYLGLKEGDNIKTTNEKYIVKVKDIKSSEVVVDVYKKIRDSYEFVNSFTFQQGEEKFSNFETLSVGASTLDGKTAILSLTGENEFTGEPDRESIEMNVIHLSLKEGDTVKTQTSKFIVEILEINEVKNITRLKVYGRDSKGNYMFLGFTGSSNNVPTSSYFRDGNDLGFIALFYPDQDVVHLDITEEPRFKGEITREGDGIHYFLSEGDIINLNNDYKVKINKIDGTNEQVSSLISFYSQFDSFYGHTIAGGNKDAPSTVTDDLTKVSIIAYPVNKTSVILSVSSKSEFIEPTTHIGDGTYTNLQVGNSMKTSNGLYIIELEEIKEDSGSYYGELRLYAKNFGEYRFKGFTWTTLAPSSVTAQGIPVKISGVVDINVTTIGTLKVEVI